MKIINKGAAPINLPNGETLNNRAVTEVNKTLYSQWKKDSLNELITTKKPTPYEIEQKPKKMEIIKKVISNNQ